jgi:hypothetical protein
VLEEGVQNWLIIGDICTFDETNENTYVLRCMYTSVVANAKMDKDSFITQKSIVLVTFLISVLSCNRTAKLSSENVFSSIKYDRVIAYNYNGDGDIEIIDKNGQLAKNIKKSTELHKSQIIEITNLLCEKTTYGDDIAACFDPHLGIVFYEGEKVNGYISICLDCNYLVSSIMIPAAESGFSKTGIDGIESFQREVGL